MERSRVGALMIAEPKPEEVQFLEDRLDEFNAAATGITGGAWLGILVRDDGGCIVAGVCGATWGGTAEIRQLWVDEALRGQGLGTRLLQEAEAEARRRGCLQMILMTFSFQAPAYYSRHGFETLAVVDDDPVGHANLLMRKRLAATFSALPAPPAPSPGTAQDRRRPPSASCGRPGS